MNIKFDALLLIVRVAALVLFFCSNNAAAQAASIGNCGSLDNAYGPFDYTNPLHVAEKLPVVEKHHFDVGVEQLKGHAGKNNAIGYLPGDIDYTLRAFPNHHRALYAMLRYYLEEVPQGAPAMRYTATCYFERATQLAPNDAIVVMLEGIYLHKADRVHEAVSRYEMALKMAPDSAEIQYNAALLYLELGQNELAVRHAKRAYELGFPLAGLRNKLIRAGLWE